ncbi:uncharacterized protein LOC112584678 isoform X2 [Bubalus bubalis]|uniref:uncharacterized protein LOC112584678 isoform X2 n=1 Tax=Bubalus bubalis TaxID=89462 RepID=UPI000DBC5D88|nr:uncharacterized protein LOC112584678 isoform X2 [Bubalus bubalis]
MGVGAEGNKRCLLNCWELARCLFHPHSSGRSKSPDQVEGTREPWRQQPHLLATALVSCGQGQVLTTPTWDQCESPVQHECRIMYDAKTQTHVSYIYLKARKRTCPR